MAQLVEALCYKLEGRRFDSRWCHSKFSLSQSFQPHNGPGVESASDRRVPGISPGRPGGAHRADNLTTFLHVPIVLKSGSLNLLEPSGPVQDCNGIALPSTKMNVPWVP